MPVGLWIGLLGVSLALVESLRLALAIPRADTGTRWLWVSGLLAGGMLALYLGTALLADSLLLVICALLVLRQSLEVSPGLRNAYPALCLIAGLAENWKTGNPLESLGRLVDQLPAGEVQTACRVAMARWHAGQPAERCWKMLDGLHPGLDELVWQLALSENRATPGAGTALEQLRSTAARRWEGERRSLRLRTHIAPAVRCAQPALLVLLIAGLIQRAPVTAVAWPSMQVLLTIAGFASFITILLLLVLQQTQRLQALFAVMLLMGGLGLAIPATLPVRLPALTWETPAPPAAQVIALLPATGRPLRASPGALTVQVEEPVRLSVVTAEPERRVVPWTLRCCLPH